MTINSEWTPADKQVGTGVIAGDTVCNNLAVMMRLEGHPERLCQIAITVDGVKHETSDPHEYCNLAAMKYGLPELPGHLYGINEYGEFMVAESAWNQWKSRKAG